MLGSLKQILLVSADKGYDFFLSDLLRKHAGVYSEINQVFSVRKAIGELHANDYDLIILDVSTGEDCKESIEKIFKTSTHIPLIVLTKVENGSLLKKVPAKEIQQVIPKTQINGQMFAQAILSVIDRKRIEGEIRMRDEILQAVNNAAEIFLTQMDWSSYLNEVLASLGKATKSDRVYVFRNRVESSGEMVGEFSAEWVDEDVQITKTGTVANGVHYERDGFSRWVKLMQAGEAIHGDVDKLPSNEQPLLMKLGVLSFIYVPIFIDHTWWGFIGFDQCTHHNQWLQVEIDALKTAAKILGAAISRKVSEEKLIYLATHDYLTNLPNRMLFEDRFRQAKARAERSGMHFAIISIDLDRFKMVNDTHGHHVGDYVLAEIANRLREATRGTDTCARIGGDEFAVIAEEIHNKADVLRVMEKISAMIGEQLSLESKTVQISASMGAAIYPLHGSNLEDLMKAADKTLYLVKGTQTRFKIFSDDQITWLKN